MEEKPITARCIIDMLGAPKEFIEQKLKEHTEQLRKNNFEIVREEYAEAKQKEGQDKLFTAFSELEIKFKDVHELLNFCFESMPSSVEILEPEDEIKLDIAAFTGFINDFQAKLHHADMILKKQEAEKKVLDTNAINILSNFIIYILRKEEKTLQELTEILGIREKELQKFLGGLEEKKIIEKKGEKYKCMI